MKGIVLAEQAHFINILPPQDIDAARTTDVFSMKDYEHATIFIHLGVTGGASTVKVQAADDFTPSNTTDLAFSIYKAETAGFSDVLGARTAVTSAGYAMTTNDSCFYVIEVDASELPDGKPNLTLAFSDPAAATYASAMAILTGGRFVGNPAQQVTEIA